MASIGLALKQFRQLRDVAGDASRLVERVGV
jgi:hypothetical protein